MITVARKRYFPKQIELREEGEDLVIVDTMFDSNENGILLTLSHRRTDLPSIYIEEFVEELIKIVNIRGRD